MSSLTEIATVELKTETEVGPSEIVVRLVGNAEMDATGPLAAFLRALHDESVKTKVSLVVVDMRGLEFMNSSCFKTFVTWISALEDSPPAEQYRVRFLSSAQRHWQARSLGALACFAVDLISVASS